ncbi:hypothetical protein AB0M43_35340 [Longispora sp. NPDC051575]|uniref:hypothetical protein n=1 Tax=Longispora sp. NPDC051575 TaxID=3154943 RepID=UPI00343EC751
MTEDGEQTSEASKAGAGAFGAGNRARLLDEYFLGTSAPTPGDAWKHVYRLLLRINRTIGLAHCYESNRTQPGEPWYARSLRFHQWVAGELGTTPDKLGEEVDWLFQRAIVQLAAQAGPPSRSGKLAEQRAPYEGMGFPEPGDDPGLGAIITEGLREWLTHDPPREAMRALTDRMRLYSGQENKRNNLTGEGFEDTVAAVLNRIGGVAGAYEIEPRKLLHDLPGFREPTGNEKPRKVDLALVRKSDQHRILVTSKWSVRADREEQFKTDFDDYANLEADGKDFDYVLITNEFDPARLVNACERRAKNHRLFTSVVHVNAAGPVIVWGKPRPKDKANQMNEHFKSGRLSSLENWIDSLIGTA